MPKKKKPPIKESHIRKQITDYLRLRGWFVFYNLAGLGCYPGLSDLVAVKRGRVIFLEVKKPGGRQGKNQKKFQEDLERAGGEYLMAFDVDDVITALE